MAWTSKTGQFGSQEMSKMESMDNDRLKNAIIGSSPVVGLRVLTEVMMNDGDRRAKELLTDSSVQAVLRSYTNDYGVTGKDHDFARQLKALK